MLVSICDTLCRSSIQVSWWMPISPSLYEQLLGQQIYTELTGVWCRAYRIRVGHYFQFCVQVKLGKLLLVKLIFTKLFALSIFALCHWFFELTHGNRGQLVHHVFQAKPAALKTSLFILMLSPICNSFLFGFRNKVRSGVNEL